MRSILVLALALTLAGCATRLPTSAPAVSPTQDLAARFVRCETEGMTREIEAAREEREDIRRNKLALFVGYTSERGEGGGQTIGLDYVRKLGERWGAGVFVDFAAGGLDSRVLGAGFSFYPFEPLFLFAGPGIEWVDGESQGLVRLGAGLEFEVGEDMFFGPSAYADILEDGKVAWIVGAVLVHEF